MLGLIYISISFIMLWALPNMRARLFFVAAVLLIIGLCNLVADIRTTMEVNEKERSSVVTMARITSLAITGAFEVSYENTEHHAVKATLFVPSAVYQTARNQPNRRGIRIKYVPSDPEHVMLENQHLVNASPHVIAPIIMAMGLCIGFFTWRTMKP